MSNRVKLIASACACTLALTGGAMAQQPLGQQQSPGQQQTPDQQRTGATDRVEHGSITETEVRTFFQQTEQDLTEAVQGGDQEAIREWTSDHVADDAAFTLVAQMGGQGRVSKSMVVTQASKQDLLRRQQAIFSLNPSLLNRISDYELSIRVRDVQLAGNGAALVKVRIRESGSFDMPRTTGLQSSQRSQAGSSSAVEDENASQSTASQGAGAGTAGASEQGTVQLFEPGSRQLGGAQFGGSQAGAAQPGESTIGEQSVTPGVAAAEDRSSVRQRGRTEVSFDGTADCTQMLQRGEDGQLEIGMMTCNAEVMF